MIESSIEVFMDNFSVFGSHLDKFLCHLNVILERCNKMNFVLNWKKFYFMINEGIILGYKVSSKYIEVDQDKIKVIKC